MTACKQLLAERNTQDDTCHTKDKMLVLVVSMKEWREWVLVEIILNHSARCEVVNTSTYQVKENVMMCK